MFAIRLARRALLRRFCSADHPVLTIEEDLVEMARSKLQEHILSHYLKEDAPGLEGAVRALMRAAAVEKASKFAEDESVRMELVEEVCSEPIGKMLTAEV